MTGEQPPTWPHGWLSSEDHPLTEDLSTSTAAPQSQQTHLERAIEEMDLDPIQRRRQMAQDARDQN